jgi:hypothetical protein
LEHSKKLIFLHIVGFKISREGYQAVGAAVAKSDSLRRLLINQSNIGSMGGALQDIANSFQHCQSVEYLDLASNGLDDNHASCIAKIISS